MTESAVYQWMAKRWIIALRTRPSGRTICSGVCLRRFTCDRVLLRPDRDGLIVHSDRGTQFTSWAFSNRLRDSGIAPSMGAVGAAGDNAMMESFWARLQVEVLNRRRWKTRIALATAIHDYIQFHNTRRRHSSLQMRTPSEIELAWTATNVAIVERALAKTASTVVLAQDGLVGLAGTSEADISIDHQHLLLNNDQAA